MVLFGNVNVPQNKTRVGHWSGGRCWNPSCKNRSDWCLFFKLSVGGTLSWFPFPSQLPRWHLLQWSGYKVLSFVWGNPSLRMTTSAHLFPRRGLKGRELGSDGFSWAGWDPHKGRGTRPAEASVVTTRARQVASLSRAPSTPRRAWRTPHSPRGFR